MYSRRSLPNDLMLLNTDLTAQFCCKAFDGEKENIYTRFPPNTFMRETLRWRDPQSILVQPITK